MPHGLWILLERLRELNDQPNRALLAPQYMASASRGVVEIPTLEKGHSRPLSPQLKQRFAFAGAWHNATGQSWLDTRRMTEAWKDRSDIARAIALRREHWHSSPPAQSALRDVALFAADLVEGGETYLVWRRGLPEPAVVEYSGWSEFRYADLAEYIASSIDASESNADPEDGTPLAAFEKTLTADRLRREARLARARKRWQRFLAEWNAELLDASDATEGVGASALRRRWMGYDAATPRALARLEVILGRTLPPSYRAFLEVTNGWRTLGSPALHSGPLLGAHRVRRFDRRHPDWIATYMDADASPLPLREHRVYGPTQDCALFRRELLRDCVQISEARNGTVLLLCPSIHTRAHEWEAWKLANWLPGATRYRSFRQLIEAERDCA